MDERARWNERYRAGEGPTRVNPRLQQFLYLLKRGRALDIAGGIGQNKQLLEGWDVVVVDISDEALARGSGKRVQADAAALPFAPRSFDSVICTNFFEPRIDYFQLLRPGGTVFFETFTVNEGKYRPEFNPAHRFDPADRSLIFKGLEILHLKETDDGRHVYATVVARKPMSG